MQVEIKNRIKKSLLWGFLGFVIFFSFRLFYGYLIYPNGKIQDTYSSYRSSSNFSFSRKNYASTKYKGGGQRHQASTSSGGKHDQKYEKVCTMSSQSSKFDKDEKQIHVAIKKYNSLIQYENRSGLQGDRHLNLAIGVPPKHFDVMILELKKIGNLKSILIDKQDKTNEFKELQAKRITLDKSLASLKHLKEYSGKIEEYMNLEQQILELEGQIQDLGVTLGDFDAENEFCTVKMTLSERKEKYIEVGLTSRIKTALEWSVKFYLGFVCLLFVATLTMFIIFKMIEKLKN